MRGDLVRSKALYLAALGFTLSLGYGCVDAVKYTPYLPEAPTAPHLRLPQNNAYEGSVVTGNLRPLFVWEASVTNDVSYYEVQYSTDVNFVLDVVEAVSVSLEFRPENSLSVSTTPPVGNRFYWRVRACSEDNCSSYSAPWTLNLGRSIKDFNGDGYDDVLVGAHAPPASSHEMGEAYVYLGGSGATFDIGGDGTFSDSAIGSWMGYSVSSAGDFNGDGFADILVGAPRSAIGGPNSGAAYIFLGGKGNSIDTSADAYVQGMPGEYLGMSVSTAGDINSDGYDDIIIGAPAAIAGSPTRAGGARLYLGSAAPKKDVPISSVALIGPGGAGLQGAGVSGAGDINGDGYADVLVNRTAYYAPDDSESCSSAVYLGGREFDTSQDGEIAGVAGEKCSLRATRGGDINADGFSDIVARINTRSEGVRIFSEG